MQNAEQSHNQHMIRTLWSYGGESKPLAPYFHTEGKNEAKSDILIFDGTVDWRNTLGILTEYSRNTNLHEKQ